MALIQIVQWDKDLDPSVVFAWRYKDPKNPQKSDALGNWTQLVVHEAQEAILFRDGQALDLFGPGRYTLSTDNIPILQNLINLPTGGASPFKAHVWFVNRLNVLDVKWGTATPLLLRDPEYGIAIPVRAFGQFGIRVQDSRKLLVKLVGPRPWLNRDELVNSFRGLILSHMGDMIATYISEKKINIFEISVYLKDMSEQAVDEVRPMFQEYGIEAVNFFIDSVNVPDDDESVQDLRKAMSERARMNVIGYNYQQQRSFDAMESMAESSGQGGGNPLMGAGMGLGAGMGMGGAFGRMASQMGQFLDAAPQESRENQTPSRSCPKCGKACTDGRFCPSCGAPVTPSCPSCGAEVPPNARFCAECGKSLQKTCSCGASLSQGAKFCAECGKSTAENAPQGEHE